MFKNRTAQLLFQAFYCTLALVGSIASLGIFDNINMIRWDFYVHFTNISNFLCIGVMVAALIETVKKKEDSFVTAAPLLKFIGILGILLTGFHWIVRLPLKAYHPHNTKDAQTEDSLNRRFHTVP